MSILRENEQLYHNNGVTLIAGKFTEKSITMSPKWKKEVESVAEDPLEVLLDALLENLIGRNKVTYISFHIFLKGIGR